MAQGNIASVLHSIKDLYGLALQVMEEIKVRLEAIMPNDKLPKGRDVAQMVENMDPITPEIQEMIITLMDHMAQAYYQAGLAAEWLSSLAKVCTPAQLTTILCCAAQPMIQVVGMPGFLQLTSGERKKRTSLMTVQKE